MRHWTYGFSSDIPHTVTVPRFFQNPLVKLYIGLIG